MASRSTPSRPAALFGSSLTPAKPSVSDYLFGFLRGELPDEVNANVSDRELRRQMLLSASRDLDASVAPPAPAAGLLEFGRKGAPGAGLLAPDTISRFAATPDIPSDSGGINSSWARGVIPSNSAFATKAAPLGSIDPETMDLHALASQDEGPHTDPQHQAVVQRRLTLAKAALMKGDFKGAEDIMRGSFTNADDGSQYDSTTGAPTGRRFPAMTNINGWNIDKGAPDNRGGYFPQLKDGIVPNGRGGVGNIDGYPGAIGGQAEAAAGGTARGEAPYVLPRAYDQAFGTGAGGAVTDLIDVPNGDGSTTKMTRAEYLARRGVRLPGSGGPPAVGGSGLRVANEVPTAVGTTQTPQSRAYDEASGKTVADLFGSIPEVRSKALAGVQTATQGFNLAEKLDPNIGLPFRRATVEMLRGMGVADADANAFAGDAKSYQAVTTQMLLDNAKALGANPSNRDAQITASVFPSLTSPKSQAQMTFATRAATARQQQAYADFLAGYQGPKDPRAVQQAWINSPAGRRSIFQDPIFAGLKVNGRPLVATTSRAASDGYRYGQVDYGGPKPYRFRIY